MDVRGKNSKGQRSKRPRATTDSVRVLSWPEDEAPCSSLSEEEDLANCLVMLSKARPPHMTSSPDSANTNFRCKTCGRNFHSHQALGGHAASHSKFKSPALHQDFADEDYEDSDPSPHSKRPHRTRDKVHECAACRRIFSTGQALGGHMRSHSAPSAASRISGTAGSAAAEPQRQRPLATALPDLNLPPPVDDEDDYFPRDGSALSCSLSGDAEDSPSTKYSDAAHTSEAGDVIY